MALRVVTELIDDLDGAPAAKTVSFGLDGTAYEIDLCNRNAMKLRSVLATYASAGRRTGRILRAAPPRQADVSRTRSEIRAWAKTEGLPVRDRGRLPVGVVAEFLRRARRGGDSFARASP